MKSSVFKKASLTSNLSITKDVPCELLELIVQFGDVKPYLSKVFSQPSVVQESIKSFWTKEVPWLKRSREKITILGTYSTRCTSIR